MDIIRKDFNADPSLKFVFLELVGSTTNVSQEDLAHMELSDELINANLLIHVKTVKYLIPVFFNVFAQQVLDGTEEIVLYAEVDKSGTTLMDALAQMDLS